MFFFCKIKKKTSRVFQSVLLDNNNQFKCAGECYIQKRNELKWPIKTAKIVQVSYSIHIQHDCSIDEWVP